MRKCAKTTLRDDDGSVLMEYAVLTLLAAIPFYLVWNGCSVPLDLIGGEPLSYPGIYDLATGQVKGVGLEIQKFFEMLQSAIALPLP